MSDRLVEVYSLSIAHELVARLNMERSEWMDTRSPTYYRITIKAHLDSSWSIWFDGMMIANQPNGEAVLIGPITDQAALYGLLAKIRDLGLPLIAVQPIAL
jgi:hypothetical protein